jgi:3-deoxy-D-manno-octulosonic acid kinase
MIALPAGWARRPFPGGALCVPERLAAVARPEWFDPRRPGAVAVGEGGRQAAWFVDGDHGAAVLRHYRRGGLRARLGRETYCWMGEGRVRAWAETRVLAHLRSAGLRVPEPLAAAYWRSGLCYRNAILVARIPGARSLAARLDHADPEAVAQAIGAMHAAGVWHADLNAYNILFDEQDRVWLIDFDRARLGVAHLAQRRKNVLRLRRSLVKVAGARGARWWDALNSRY